MATRDEQATRAAELAAVLLPLCLLALVQLAGSASLNSQAVVYG